MRGVRILLMAFLLALPVHAQQWSVVTSGVDTNLRGVSAVFGGASKNSGTTIVWASGSNGVILQSRDTGAHWKQLRVAGGETLDFRSIQAFGAKTAYVMSSGEGEKSRIYKTRDGGETWKVQFSDQRSEFFLDALVCASEKQCFAISDPVDGKFLLVSTIDGEHWNELPRDNMPVALPSEGAFAASGSCLAVYDKRELYFVTGGPAARVFRSVDLGRTWTVMPTPIASGNASSGAFSIARVGSVVVSVGGDYKDVSRPMRTAANSYDRGGTWNLAAQPPGGFRSAVAFLDLNTLVAVGTNGEDISRDQGAHWVRIGSLDLNAIAVADRRNAWAAGPNGMIARLTVFGP